MHSWWRVIKFAWQDIGRNPGLSLMTVFMLVLMLLSLNALWAVEVVGGEAVRLVKGQVNMSLFLRPQTSDAELTELSNYLKNFPAVASIAVRSREETLVDFKERYVGKTEVLQALGELSENPFGPTIVLTAEEPSVYKNIVAALAVPEYDRLIETKSFDEHEDAIGRLETIIKRVEQVGGGLLILFTVIAFFIIFNTIRVAIYTQRMEISIKRLVGANNWFIRGPYLVVSALFTLFSCALTLAVVLVAARFLDPYITIVFSNGFSLTNYYRINIVSIFGGQALLVLVLTVFSSTLAMRRQLRV